MSLQTDLAAAVAAAQSYVATFRAIIHGPAAGSASLVATDNGNVPTLARAASTGVVGPAAWALPIAWATGLVCSAAAPATVVTNGGNTYVCTVAHTAGAGFGADLAAGKWLLIAQGVSTGSANNWTGTNTFPTQVAGDNSQKAATTAYADRSASNAIAAYVIRSYLAGLGTSNNLATPNTKIDVATGSCADSTNAAMLNLAATTLDCSTVGANGLDTGTLANNTWYLLFVIGKVDGTTALFASTSSAPVLPVGYTYKRRIAYFRTNGSAQVRAFHQYGDRFEWDSLIADVNGAPTSNVARVARTLTVPPNTLAIFNFVGGFPTVNAFNSFVITSSNQADVGPNNYINLTTLGSTVAPSYGTPVAVGPQLKVRTNGSSQVYDRDLQNAAVYYSTVGWIDSRGRDA